MKYFWISLFTLCLTLFVITSSISLPIYFRSFYYVQIDTLHIAEETGYDKATIKEAYDEVLDFLTLHKKFGTGKLSYSKEGKAHFVDCQKLFDINLAVMVVSLCVVLTLLVLEKLKKINLSAGGFHASFFAGVCAIVLPLVLLVCCATNFERAFEVFHHICFPGKDNWQFDPEADAVIDILPEKFFLNSAILICTSLVAFSAILIIIGVVKRHKSKKKNKTGI